MKWVLLIGGPIIFGAISTFALVCAGRRADKGEERILNIIYPLKEGKGKGQHEEIFAHV